MHGFKPQKFLELYKRRMRMPQQRHASETGQGGHILGKRWDGMGKVLPGVQYVSTFRGLPRMRVLTTVHIQSEWLISSSQGGLGRGLPIIKGLYK